MADNPFGPPSSASSPSAQAAVDNPFGPRTQAAADNPFGPPSGKKRQPSVLERIGNVLEAPADIFNARAMDVREYAREHPGATTTPGGGFAFIGAEQKRAMALLKQGKFTEAADRYAIGSQPVLESQAHAVDPLGSLGASLAQNELKYPVVRGLASFGEEFLNPGNLLVGPLLKAGGAAARTVPGVAKGEEAVRHAVGQVFNRFEPLRPLGPVGETLERQRLAEIAKAKASAEQEGQHLLEGLTAAQQTEVGRLSQGLAPKPEIPQPKGASLKARGLALRSLIKRTTGEQVQYGLLKPEEVFDPETYLPMRKFGDRPVYADRSDQEAGTFEGAFSGMAPGGRGVRISRGYATKHKVFPTIDEAAARGFTLDPNFLLSHQIMNDLAVKRGNVANERFLQRLENAVDSEGNPIRQQTHFTLTAPNGSRMDFGYGQTGAKNYAAWARSEGKRRALVEAAGIMSRPDLLSARRQAPAYLTGKFRGTQAGVSGAQGVARSAERGAAKIGAEQAKGVADVVKSGESIQDALKQPLATANVSPLVNQRAQKIVGRMTERAGQHAQRTTDIADAVAAGASHEVAQRAASLDDVLKKLDQARARNKDLQDLRALAARLDTQIIQHLKDQVERESAPAKGYMREGPLGMGSPTGPYHELRTPMFEYLRLARSVGAPVDQAGPLARFAEVLNRLGRLGIILFPTVHAIWNLGFNYLGAGGKIEDLVGKAGELDARWAGRAQRAGAMPSFRIAHLGLKRGTKADVLTRPINEPGLPLGVRADIGFSRGYWQHNQRLVFGIFERRYATALFRRLVKHEGMDDGEAAARVRKALGDYDNITPLEARASGLFLFYPWMKTTLAFWARAGLLKPQYWHAPIQGAQAANLGFGTTGTSNPFSVVQPAGKGRERVWTLPVPQRVVSDLVDPLKGTGYVFGHLNPAIQTALSFSPKIIYDPYAGAFDTYSSMQDLSKYGRPAQIARSVTSRFLAPERAVSNFMQEPAVGAGAFLAGGFLTEEPDPAARKRINRLKRHFSSLILKDRDRGDEAAAVRHYDALQRAIERIRSGQSALAPLPVGPSTPNPFGPSSQP